MVFVNDSYQKHLEDFDRIKQNAADLIRDNTKRMGVMRDWKTHIRSILMAVRSEFVEWVPPTYARGKITSTTIVLKDILS